MFSGNFRVLIFIDLLATALGGSLILMMILSTSKDQSPPPAGVARNFIFYQIYSEDPNAFLKIIVQNGDNNKWMESIDQEFADSTSGTFLLKTDDNQDVFSWGPVTEYDTANKVAVRNGIGLKNMFNIYSTSQKEGIWTLGALYYNHKSLNGGQLDNINKQVKIHHHLETIDGVVIFDTITTVTLGNYGYIKYNMKSKEP